MLWLDGAPDRPPRSDSLGQERHGFLWECEDDKVVVCESVLQPLQGNRLLDAGASAMSHSRSSAHSALSLLILHSSSTTKISPKSCSDDYILKLPMRTQWLRISLVGDFVTSTYSYILQSLPVPLSTITLSVVFHSFSYSVTARLPSGLHIHCLYRVSLILHPQFATFTWITSAS